MFQTLAIIQCLTAIFLILFIAVTKSSKDAISGMGGGYNMPRSSEFNAFPAINKIIIVLAIIFVINNIALSAIHNKTLHKPSIMQELISESSSPPTHPHTQESRNIEPKE